MVKTIPSIANTFLSISSPLSLTKKVRLEATNPYFMNHADGIIKSLSLFFKSDCFSQMFAIYLNFCIILI